LSIACGAVHTISADRRGLFTALAAEGFGMLTAALYGGTGPRFIDAGDGLCCASRSTTLATYQVMFDRSLLDDRRTRIWPLPKRAASDELGPRGGQL